MRRNQTVLVGFSRFVRGKFGGRRRGDPKFPFEFLSTFSIDTRPKVVVEDLETDRQLFQQDTGTFVQISTAFRQTFREPIQNRNLTVPNGNFKRKFLKVVELEDLAVKLNFTAQSR